MQVLQQHVSDRAVSGLTPWLRGTGLSMSFALCCVDQSSWTVTPNRPVVFFPYFLAFSEVIFLSLSPHPALFYFLWGSRQDVHDDVQTVAECSA